MSQKDYLERQTQQHLINNPHTPHLTPQQQPDYWTRQVVNNEMDRVRAEEDRKRREGR